MPKMDVYDIEGKKVSTVELKEEMIAHDRKAMIEDGVFDEYTKVSNAADDIGYTAGFFKKKLPLPWPHWIEVHSSCESKAGSFALRSRWAAVWL